MLFTFGCSDKADALQKLQSALQDGDHVGVKGKLSMGKTNVTAFPKLHTSEGMNCAVLPPEKQENVIVCHQIIGVIC